jgi:hypothetical protein
MYKLVPFFCKTRYPSPTTYLIVQNLSKLIQEQRFFCRNAPIYFLLADEPYSCLKYNQGLRFKHTDICVGSHPSLARPLDPTIIYVSSLSFFLHTDDFSAMILYASHIGCAGLWRYLWIAHASVRLFRVRVCNTVWVRVWSSTPTYT